jgi:hypothetical protein
MRTAKYLTMLDAFAANLAGMTDNEDELQWMRLKVAQLREELQACEALELTAQGIPAQPPAHGAEPTGQRQTRARLHQRLEGVVEHIRRGYPLHLRQDWAGAARQFQAAQAELRTTVVSRLLADIGIQLNHYAEALALCDEAEKLCEQRKLSWVSELVWLRGVIYGKQSRYQEALAEDERAAALLAAQGLPPNPNLAMHRGFLLGNLGQWEAALAAYAECNDLRAAQGLPEDAEASLGVGICYEALGKNFGAQAALNRTAELRQAQGLPPDEELTIRRGYYHYQRREYSLEEEIYLDYERQCRQHGLPLSYQVAKELLRVRLAFRRPEDTQLAYKHAEELRLEQKLPEDPKLYWLLGQVYGLLEQTQSELDELLRAEALYREQGLPVHPQLLYEQALAHGSLFSQAAMCEAARRAEAAYNEQGGDMPEMLRGMLQECDGES